jgi:hypothetical protein
MSALSCQYGFCLERCKGNANFIVILVSLLFPCGFALEEPYGRDAYVASKAGWQRFSMDNMAIADRRRLRRKLTFWRIAAVLLLVAGIFGLYRFLWTEPQQSAKPHIARVEISGLIQDNTELLERLDKIAKSDNVKGLIVSISSPGGTTYGGERIFKAIRGVA